MYAHHADARLLKHGISSRPLTLTPGLLNKLIYQLVIKGPITAVAPVAVEEELSDGDVLPLLGASRWCIHPAIVPAT